ncbi:hypothetical protein TTHERM_01545790, partial (macronuclear) [Tetrahymena thermophila SB210]
MQLLQLFNLCSGLQALAKTGAYGYKIKIYQNQLFLVIINLNCYRTYDIQRMGIQSKLSSLIKEIYLFFKLFLKEGIINLKHIQLQIYIIYQLKKFKKKKNQMSIKEYPKIGNLLQKFFYLLLLISLISAQYMNLMTAQYDSIQTNFQPRDYTMCNNKSVGNVNGVNVYILHQKVPSFRAINYKISMKSPTVVSPQPYIITTGSSGEGYTRPLDPTSPNCIDIPMFLSYSYSYFNTITFNSQQNSATITISNSGNSYIYQFEITLQQIQCQEGCYDCLDGQNCKENSCLSGFNYMISSYFNQNQKICNRICPNGQYTHFIGQNPLTQNCQNCISNCLICSDQNQCSQCITGYYFDSQQKLCVKLTCVEGCSNCSQNKQSCTQCMSGYTQMVNPNNSALQYCQKNCAVGQYNFVIENTYMTQQCRSCIANCQTCTGPNDCSNCYSGYGYNSQTKQCAQCYQGCSNCDQNLSCTQCISGYTQTTNPNNNSQQYCKMICPIGQFTFINWQTMAQQCNPCITNCTQCSQDKQCDNCAANYEFIQQVYQCKMICQQNQYRDSTLYNCTNCVSNCQQCVDGQSCSQCQSNYEYISQVNSCLLICNQNQYRNPQNNYLCADCIDNCASCTNGQSCTTCVQDYEYIQQVSKCMHICSQNQFRDSTQNYQCINCHSSCQSCTGPAQSQCSSCYQGWYQLGSYCYQWCPNNYKEDSTLWQCVQCQEYIKPDCQACANTCKSCQYKQSDICLDCYDSMEMSGNTCICKNKLDTRGIFYECSYNNIAVLQATLAIDSPTMIIDFGVALTQIQNFQCNTIFQDSTLQLLGNLPNCSIQDTKIKIQLGNDAQIMENDNLSFISNVLSYQISSTFLIDTFYLTKVQQQRSDTQQPQVTIQFSKTQNNCYDIIFSLANIINDAQRGFKSFAWSILSSPSLDQNNLQAVNSIVDNANSQKSTTL